MTPKISNGKAEGLGFFLFGAWGFFFFLQRNISRMLSEITASEPFCPNRCFGCERDKDNHTLTYGRQERLEIFIDDKVPTLLTALGSNSRGRQFSSTVS